VFNSRLPENQRQNRKVYDPSKSATFKEVADSTFKISYGDSSSASGGVGKDKVTIGGVVVDEQIFGVPTEVSGAFVSDTDSNGLVGLGFSSINTIKPGPQKTFFDNVVSSLDEPVFSVRLRTNGVGEYEFGTIDHSKYKGVLAEVSVDSSNGFWQFSSAQYSIDGGSFNPINDVPEAIADTGTSLMLVSPDVATAYYNQVDGAIYAKNAGGYIYPCTAKLPSLAVAIGTEYSATVPGSLINFSEVGTNTTTGETGEFSCNILFIDYTDLVIVCFGGVQSNAGSSLAIYGDVFLKALFVVFDHRGPSLGIAAPA
jgi:aspergillopepsin I